MTSIPLHLPELSSLSSSATSSELAKASNAQQIAKVAGDFESVFVSIMLKEMRSSLEPDTLFGGDTSDIYGSMFDLFLGQHVTEAGGIGLAQMVESYLETIGDRSPAKAAIPSNSADVS